jgi:hypothetical protein
MRKESCPERGRERWDQRVLRENPGLTQWTSDSFGRVFEKRRIAKEVFQARGYAPYDAGEIDVLCAADPKYSRLSPGVRGSVRRTINQRPGIIMPRYPIPGAPDLYAQIRPFKFSELSAEFDLLRYGLEEDPGVFNGTWSHQHLESYQHRHTPKGAVLVGPRLRTGYRRPAHAGAWLTDHLEREHGKDGYGYVGVGALEMVPETEVHTHCIDWTSHVANAAYLPEHAQHDPLGPHTHAQYAKYVYVSGGKVVNERVERPAKVIDVHPLALPLIQAGGRRCFFALEGLLKNDSILSQGEPVFNCGSVTLWDDPALEDFANEWLRRFETVVVVPDSDWIGNEQVADQARRVLERLGEWGIRAIIAAPPPTCSGPTGNDACVHARAGTSPTGTVADHKNGVDDWLGQCRTLDEMITWEHPDGSIELPTGIGRQYRSRQRNVIVLQYLIEAQTPRTGRVRRPLREIGRSLSMGKDAVWRALQDLQEAGVVSRIPPGDLYFGYDPMTTIELCEELRCLIPRELGDVT